MKAKIIACETVAELLKESLVTDMPCQTLRFGLHVTPAQLHVELQQAIDNTDGEYDTLLLGYGSCGRGTVGLSARRFRLVIPKVDDCIGLFLGSRARHRERVLERPGTFYLTKGWIECGDDPYTEYLKLCDRYSSETAYRLEKMAIQNYSNLALVNTGESGIEKYRAYARRIAAFFGLQFEEIAGSTRLLAKMIRGDWDEEFVVVEPGGVCDLDMFFDLNP